MIMTTGLNEIVPDNLLSMFDENELEVSCNFSIDIHLLEFTLCVFAAAHVWDG